MADGEPGSSFRSAIARMAIFESLDADALNEAIALARVEPVAPDQRILSQGDPAVRAYAVLEGSVRIRQTGSDGAQALMRFIAPQEMFGAVAIFTDRRYPADAEAVTNARVVSWSEADLHSLIGRYSGVALAFIRMIGKRLGEAQERIREMATQSAERRVAHVLLRLADQAGQSTAEGVAIRIPLRRKDVAELAGTTLHTASRVLTGWEKAGLLGRRHRTLTVRNGTKLRAIAADERGFSR